MVQQKKVPLKKSPRKKIVRMSGMPLSGGTGRRKKAVARVWARRGSGAIVVNGLDYKEYFDTSAMRLAVGKPLAVHQPAANYDFQVNVFGGGKVGQSHAVKLGISKALLANDATIRPLLRQNGLLTVDSRIKERKKYGQRGARAKFQFVKR
jgi:small subunit ribosomal protein S9